MTTWTCFFPFCGLGAGALGFLQARVQLRDEELRFTSLGGIDNDPLGCEDEEGADHVWILDLTATQFADEMIGLRPRRVVVAQYGRGYGRHYRVQTLRAHEVRWRIQACDRDDVWAFEAAVAKWMGARRAA